MMILTLKKIKIKVYDGHQLKGNLLITKINLKGLIQVYQKEKQQKNV